MPTNRKLDRDGCITNARDFGGLETASGRH